MTSLTESPSPNTRPDVSNPEPDAHQQLIQIMAGLWVARAIQVAAGLRLADQFDESSRTVDELAAATQTHAPSLYRLMRALAGVGVFAEEAPGRFRHTAVSRLLRTSEPGTMRAFIESVLGGAHLRAWCDLDHSIRTGETAFNHTHGEGVWSYLARHEQEQRTFDQAMSDFTAVVNPAVVSAYPFANVGTLLDVGGGHGALLASILKANPGTRGVLFDQPHVVNGARQRLIDEGVAARCDLAGGDFFEAVPSCADACLMKFILHDWDDERCTRILRNVHRALPPGGKLLVVETVVPAGNEPSLSKLMDLNMLAMTGGRERTEAEFAQLLAGADFDLVKVRPTEGPLSIVEAVRR